jgi:hypothetical protein
MATLSLEQKLNFLSLLEGTAGACIGSLNKLQAILDFGNANGFFDKDPITADDLMGTSFEGLPPEQILAIAASVGGVVQFLQENKVFETVAPILRTPEV